MGLDYVSMKPTFFEMMFDFLLRIFFAYVLLAIVAWYSRKLYRREREARRRQRLPDEELVSQYSAIMLNWDPHLLFWSMRIPARNKLELKAICWSYLSNLVIRYNIMTVAIVPWTEDNRFETHVFFIQVWAYADWKLHQISLCSHANQLANQPWSCWCSICPFSIGIRESTSLTVGSPLLT